MAHHSKKEIEKMLERVGMSNLELANMLGLSPGTISRWKKREVVPTSTWRRLKELGGSGGNKRVFRELSQFSNEELIEEVRRRLLGESSK